MQTEDKLESLTVAEASGLADWREAMEREYQSLIHNNTWELVPLPPHKTVVNGKWCYQAKTNARRTVQQHKARYVARLGDSHNDQGSISRKQPHWL
jgi:hypothetical protein